MITRQIGAFSVLSYLTRVLGPSSLLESIVTDNITQIPGRRRWQKLVVIKPLLINQGHRTELGAELRPWRDIFKGWNHKEPESRMGCSVVTFWHKELSKGVFAHQGMSRLPDLGLWTEFDSASKMEKLLSLQWLDSDNCSLIIEAVQL